MEMFGSVFEQVPGKEYLGVAFKGLAYVLAALTALFGVLYKLNKLPFTWVPMYKTAVRTKNGDLRILKHRWWRNIYTAVIKRAGHGLVFFVPYGRPIEEFDHRIKSQNLESIIIEIDGVQWAVDPVIRSRLGRDDADIWHAWELEDGDAQVRARMGEAIHNSLRSWKPEQLVDSRSRLASLITGATLVARNNLRAEFGIEVIEVLCPRGLYKTQVQALREFGKRDDSNVIPLFASTAEVLNDQNVTDSYAA